MYLSDYDVLQIFRELPDHRGSAEQELNDAESELNARFPTVYREMMRLDADRLASSGIVASLRELKDLRDDASSLLIEDGHSFRLSPEHVVFAWEDICAFYFFRGVGDHDTPVMMFNYNSSEDDWKPRVLYNTLHAYFCDRLRQYLRLPPYQNRN